MDEYEVAAFDMRGYGESEIPNVRCRASHRVDCIRRKPAVYLHSDGHHERPLRSSRCSPPHLQIMHASNDGAKPGQMHHSRNLTSRRVSSSVCTQGRTEYSIEKLVDDVVGVIRHLGHEKCILVGHGASS